METSHLQLCAPIDMATESAANGSSAGTEGMSAAERLMKQHAEKESGHQPTVEDAVDEEYTLHPPPSGAASLPISTDASRVATPSAEPAMSAKAAGKQPVRDKPQPAAPAPSKPGLDTQSEAAFPALGGPKTQPAAAAPSPWSKKPAAVGRAANGMSNGMANGNTAPSTLSSGHSTPMSGLVTPSSTAPSQRGPVPQMSLPGRYSEQIQLHPSHMTPRSQLKKPVLDILRDINKRSKAHVEMKAGQGGLVVFEGTGPVEAVRVALKEVATQLCSKVCSHICSCLVSMLIRSPAKSASSRSCIRPRQDCRQARCHYPGDLQEDRSAHQYFQARGG